MLFLYMFFSLWHFVWLLLFLQNYQNSLQIYVQMCIVYTVNLSLLVYVDYSISTEIKWLKQLFTTQLFNVSILSNF